MLNKLFISFAFIALSLTFFSWAVPLSHDEEQDAYYEYLRELQVDCEELNDDNDAYQIHLTNPRLNPRREFVEDSSPDEQSKNFETLKQECESLYP